MCKDTRPISLLGTDYITICNLYRPSAFGELNNYSLLYSLQYNWDFDSR
nr:MAG TPA: hypothetical protein [Caudoviricetes sp.]